MQGSNWLGFQANEVIGQAFQWAVRTVGLVRQNKEALVLGSSLTVWLLGSVAPFQFALVSWGLVQGLDLKQRLPAFLCDIFVFL